MNLFINENKSDENLKFIASLPIAEKRISMVVQDNNFMEMGDFYDLMSEIFKNKGKIFFKKKKVIGTFIFHHSVFHF